MINEPWRDELIIPTVSCKQSIEEQIASSLENIQESCSLLNALKCTDVDWKQTIKQCDDLQWQWKQQPLSYEKYEAKIRDLLQTNLNLPIDLRNTEVRSKEISDVLFYTLFNGDHPEHAQDILSRFHKPLAEIRYSWYKLACSIIQEQTNFDHFYYRLGNRTDSLECLLYKHTDLLLNKQSYLLVCQLMEVLPYKTLLQTWEKRRSKTGETHMFYTGCFKPYVKLFQGHTTDLYNLLSIRDKNGRTALFMSKCRMPKFTDNVLRIIMSVYSPRHLKQLQQLLDIKDAHGRKALDLAEGYVHKILAWLTDQLLNNRYPLYKRPTILIAYSTTERSGAEEEAHSMYDAFKSREFSRTILKKNFKEKDIIDLIQRLSSILNSALIVVLMSHGGVGYIEDSSGQPIELKSIEDAMCSGTAMKERPKILITESCHSRDKLDIAAAEGTGSATTDESNSKPGAKVQAYVPTNPHFCAIMSSVSSQNSTRNVFMPKLAEQIKNCAENQDITKLVHPVSQQMENEGIEQTPIVASTLKADFCLGNSKPYIEWTDKETDIMKIMAEVH